LLEGQEDGFQVPKKSKKKKSKKSKNENAKKIDEDPETVHERLCDQLFPQLTRIRRTLRVILNERGAWSLPDGYIEERKKQKMRALEELEEGKEVEKNELENKVEEGKEGKQGAAVKRTL